MICLFIATIQKRTRLICDKSLIAFASINFKPNSRNEFGKPYVKYLGHVVGSGELRVDSDKVAAVLNWEPPKDIKGVVMGWVCVVDHPQDAGVLGWS